MNYAIVFRLLGYVMLIEGALLLLPAAASWIYGEWFVLGVFLITAAVSAAIGYALRGIKPKSKVFYMREGFAATAESWITISIMGAVPFVLTGCIPNPVDAMFETVSGFTTTGASILPAVEGLPNGILFWRSFTHWIGGMGVLVFLLSLLPLTGGSHVNLMKAESPGPQVDKLVPKVQSTAKILYGIYFALTVLEVVFLLLGGMPLFESMLTAFGTAGTGGGIKVSRLLILGKTLRKELKQALHPQVVAPVRMDGKLLNHETIRTTNVFVAAYIFIFAASFFLISLNGFDMVTNFTAVAATLNNIGPGLAQVGPMMNFGSFTNPAKLVMIFDMLAGRLEIFPMLVLFLPDTWRRF